MLLKRHTQTERRTWLAWLTICFFWGTGYLAYRIGVQNAPPLLFAGLRILAAGLLLAGWLHGRGAKWPRRADWWPLILVGLLTEAFANGVLAWSAQWLASGLLAILIAMTPFWMVGLDTLLPGGERLTGRTLLGLLLGFGGLAWLVLPQLRGVAWNSRVLAGCSLMQVVCLFYAAGSLVVRRKPVSVPPLVGAGWQMIFAGLALTLAGTLAGEWTHFLLGPRSLLAFTYLLVFGSIVGFGAYIYALQHLPVSTVALHRYVNPIVALLLGWLVLREPFTGRDMTAVLVIFAGVVLVQTRTAQT